MKVYEGRMKLGRLTCGAQKDHGSRVHAVEKGTTAAYCRGKAACGAEPGRRSCGWSDVETAPIDCPGCLRVLAKEAKSAG